MAKWYNKGAPVANPIKAEVVDQLKDLGVWTPDQATLPGEVLVQLLVGHAIRRGRALEAAEVRARRESAVH